MLVANSAQVLLILVETGTWHSKAISDADIVELGPNNHSRHGFLQPLNSIMVLYLGPERKLCAHAPMQRQNAGSRAAERARWLCRSAAMNHIVPSGVPVRPILDLKVPCQDGPFPSWYGGLEASISTNIMVPRYY